jgi:hypothetical protein
MVASQTGSQLPAYANGSANVLWVAGAQKIVPTLKEAYERIEQYVLPLEGERANKAYHITTGSAINKLFILMKEKKAGRITLILVKEVLGF